MSIEGIVLEHFSSITQTLLLSAPLSHTHNSVFNFFSDKIKQDNATNDEHIKNIIELLKNQKIIFSDLDTIWENIYGYAEHYIYATELFLLSMLSQAYNIITDRGTSVPGNVRKVVDDLKDTDNFFFYIKWLL